MESNNIYKIYDTISKVELRQEYKSAKVARSKVNSKNQEYGCYRYSLRLKQNGTN